MVVTGQRGSSDGVLAGSDGRGPIGSERISEDVDGADLSGVVGTPTLFVDGRRYQGQLDRQDLVEMVQVQQLRQLSTR